MPRAYASRKTHVGARSARARSAAGSAPGEPVSPLSRQAITAAGHGCQAALDCERWLDKILDVGY